MRGAPEPERAMAAKPFDLIGKSCCDDRALVLGYFRRDCCGGRAGFRRGPMVGMLVAVVVGRN